MTNGDWIRSMNDEELATWLHNICHYEYGKDDLVRRGWVLLHNPQQGIAIPTRDITREYTKAQKEFLYDYYMERDCRKEANAIWQE